MGKTFLLSGEKLNINILLKYKVLSVENANKLVEKKKLKINNAEGIIKKYEKRNVND